MSDDVTRVILVDDHDMVLGALTAVLEEHESIRIAGTARSRREAIDLLAAVPADVVVCDFHLGDGRGTDLVDHAQRLRPPIPVLLVTGNDDRSATEAALASGCAGFVSKTQSYDQLVDAVLGVARGAAVFPAALLTSALLEERAAADSRLSTREREVLQLLADALTASEIAQELHLSIHTVRNHIRQILSKLGARSQLEAVVIGVRRSEISIN